MKKSNSKANVLKYIGQKPAIFQLSAGVVLASLACTPVFAQVPFTSGVLLNQESCEIVVNSSGIMTTNAGETVLSSREAGGQGGVATVTSRKLTGNPPGLGPVFWVSFEAPSTFTSMPVGGDVGVTFEARFSGRSISRGRNFNNRAGTNPRRLRRRGVSITEITGDLIATRTGSSYPPGSYSAIGVLRCEQ